MIKTETKKGGSIKEIRKRDAAEREDKLRKMCEERAIEKFTEAQIKKWSVEHKGLWYLPCLDEDGEKIEFLLIFKPINRTILSYATTKIQDEGLYEFLEAAMRECVVAGDMQIIDEDEYFIPAANQFNKILEGKKAALLKR